MMRSLCQLLATQSFSMAFSSYCSTDNRLTNLGVTNGGATPVAIASYAYTVDNAGHRTGVTELSGRAVNYGYDNLYRLTNETIASDPNAMNGAVSYTYDAVGNRTQKVSTLPGYPGGLTNYNANDQIGTDTYDAEGNTTASNGTGYVYDFENHLLQANGITYVYDGDGNRVSKTVAGVTTTYLVDDQNPTGYAQVLQEQVQQSGVYPVEYVYGLEQFTRFRRFYDAGGNFNRETIFYEHDGHGSVRSLTDGNGTVLNTYDYDAFGTLLHSTGTLPNNYLFAGEQFDPDLGMYFNRARYLNVTTGLFWTIDTDEGSDQDPLSLHKYLYASDDPVGRIDPSGNEDIAELSAGFSISETLDSMPTIQATTFLNAAKVEVHFDLLASVSFRKYHHAYLVVRGAGGPPTIFRGGPSGNSCGAGAASDDLSGSAGKSEEPGCGYLTQAGSGDTYVPGHADYPKKPTDNVATVQVPNVSHSYNQVISDFKKSAQTIEDLHLPYLPISQNSNSFSHTLIVKSNLISPSPPVWAPGWDHILY